MRASFSSGRASPTPARKWRPHIDTTVEAVDVTKLPLSRNPYRPPERRHELVDVVAVRLASARRSSAMRGPHRGMESKSGDPYGNFMGNVACNALRPQVRAISAAAS